MPEYEIVDQDMGAVVISVDGMFVHVEPTLDGTLEWTATKDLDGDDFLAEGTLSFNAETDTPDLDAVVADVRRSLGGEKSMDVEASIKQVFADAEPAAAKIYLVMGESEDEQPWVDGTYKTLEEARAAAHDSALDYVDDADPNDPMSTISEDGPSDTISMYNTVIENHGDGYNNYAIVEQDAPTTGTSGTVYVIIEEAEDEGPHVVGTYGTLEEARAEAHSMVMEYYGEDMDPNDPMSSISTDGPSDAITQYHNVIENHGDGGGYNNWAIVEQKVGEEVSFDDEEDEDDDY